MNIKKAKYVKIAAEMREEILSQTLAPGDRIPAIKELCAYYKAGQSVVDQAIDVLKSEGLIISRKRSGNYVTEKANDGVIESNFHADRDLLPGQLLDFMSSKSSRSKEVSMYILGVSEEDIQPWRKVFSSLTEINVKIHSCLDGHLDDMVKQHFIDIVHATPALLEGLDKNNYYSYQEIKGEVVNFNEKDMIPSVQLYLSESNESLHGIPFSITGSYLYFNSSVAESQGLEVPDFDDAMDWLVWMANASLSLEDKTQPMLVTDTPSDLLMATGALQLKGSELSVDHVVLDKLCSLIECGMIKINSRNPVRAIELFCRGTILSTIHCTFLVDEVKKRLGTECVVKSVPHLKKSRSIGNLTMLSIHKDSSCLDECYAVLNHLLELKNRYSLTEKHNNLPVSRKEVQLMKSSGCDPVPFQVFQDQMASTYLASTPKLHQTLTAKINFPQCFYQLSEGKLSHQQAVELLSEFISHLS